MESWRQPQGGLAPSIVLLVAATGLVFVGSSAIAAGPAQPNHVVVNEVASDVPTPEAGNEWVELYNPTAVPVTLDGWKLTDHDSGFGGGDERLDGIVLLPQEHRNITLDNVRLGNGGDDLDLVDPEATIVDSAHYGNTGPLPAADEGQTLQRYFVLDEDGLADGGEDDWMIAEPTPGEANPIGSGPASE